MTPDSSAPNDDLLGQQPEGDSPPAGGTIGGAPPQQPTTSDSQLSSADSDGDHPGSAPPGRAHRPLVQEEPLGTKETGDAADPTVTTVADGAAGGEPKSEPVVPDALGVVPVRDWRRRPILRPAELDGLPVPSAWMMDRVDLAPGGRDPEVQVWAASARGLAHEYAGEPRQDSYAIRVDTDEEWVVVAVADGLGSSAHSELASETAANAVASSVAQGLSAAGSGAIDRIDHARMKGFLDDCFAVAARKVDDRRRALGLEDPRTLLTTLSVALIPARRPGAGEPIASAWIAWIGDSPIAKIQGGHANPITPWADGSATDGPIESAPTETLTTHRANVQHRQIDLAPGEALVLTTDGFGTPLLNDHNDHLSGQMTALFTGAIPDHLLAFVRAIDFRDANFSDDRTAVAVWRPGDGR